MDQLSFLWVWFPWRWETCLSRLNGWPGERTPGRASIVTSCVSGLLSCDGLMSPLGNVGSLLSAPMVSLLPLGLVLLGALVQSWLLSAELRVSMSGAARGCHRSWGGGASSSSTVITEPSLFGRKSLVCGSLAQLSGDRSKQSLQGPAPAVSLHWPWSCIRPHLVLRAGSLSALFRWHRPPDHACGPHPTLPLCFFKKLFYFWLFWVLVVVQAFAGCGKQWLLLVVVLGLLLLPSTGCRAHGLISCGSQVLECGLKPRSCNYWALSWENPLEKGMTTHSSILAWRIPWTEEPGRL